MPTRRSDVARGDVIARDSPHCARRFTERLAESVENPSDFPRIGRRAPEADRDGAQELIFHAYRIIYLIETEEITILTVVHGSRDLGRRRPPPWEVT